MDATQPPQSSRYVIPVVRSTFQIIHDLAQNGATTLNEVTRRTQTPKSTAFRILATLVHEGIVARDPDQKTYRLGSTFKDLARESQSMDVLRRVALPHMLKLRHAFGETVNLGELQHDTVVYVEVVPSEFALRLSERPGAKIGALSTALGRAILAFSPPLLLAGLLKAGAIPALTPFTITDPKRLKRELAKIRSQGYAVEREESALQATCIGAPILDEQGHAMAALSISGPTHRFRPTADKRIADALKQTAQEIGQEFSLQ